VILFGTDQPASSKFYHRDTIEAAKLLAQLIRSRFMGRVQDVEARAVQAENPNLYDAAYLALAPMLGGEGNATVGTHRWDRVYACLAGGVPALNSALRSLVIEMYGARARLVAVSEQPGVVVGSAQVMDTWPFRRQAILATVATLLQRHDYDGVSALLQQEEDSPPRRNAGVLSALTLSQYGASLLNQDYKGAEEAATRFETLRHDVPDAGRWRDLLATDWSAGRLRLLAGAARLACERGDFLGFVARAAVFMETCRRLLVDLLWNHLRLSGPRLEVETACGATTRLEGARAGKSNAKTWLKSCSLAPDRGNSWPINARLLDTLAQGGSPIPPAPASVAVDKIREALKKLQPVEELRHRSLHLASGISEAELLSCAEPALASDRTYFLGWFNHQVEAIINAMVHLEQEAGRAPAEGTEGEEVYDRLAQTILDEIQSAT